MKDIKNADVFSRNLRRYVEESGMRSMDVAASIGVTPAAVSDWMNGKKYPRIDKIELLADLFHILKSDLIEDKSAASPDARPMSSRARILAYGFDQLPPEAQKRAEDMMELFFERYSDSTKGKDDPDARPEH